GQRRKQISQHPEILYVAPSPICVELLGKPSCLALEIEQDFGISSAHPGFCRRPQSIIVIVSLIGSRLELLEVGGAIFRVSLQEGKALLGCVETARGVLCIVRLEGESSSKCHRYKIRGCCAAPWREEPLGFFLLRLDRWTKALRTYLVINRPVGRLHCEQPVHLPLNFIEVVRDPAGCVR